ncbi:hypothetical protein CWB96_13430 [Pseudoalteromonas citrea]|uniref:Uncharacterized protein n=1 Tax=Pseudoalteromonas citrea TaxID=43655 RepID=A0A5S3XMN9_9GAMM|nr:hypothetical protein [Pseudoalteromonas citrea]TMP46595.1 hypothetical protein CWB97_01660 [Pseudoalteromonas citrea]TMP57616.1 hypothetical protein CWB96_13430 [Pseudoalteromonas citrea]
MKKSILALVIAAAITGCGSSEDVSNVEPSASLESTSSNITKVSGYVGNGSIQGATVTVSKIINNAKTPFENDEVNSSSLVTDENGFYSIEISNYTGPIKIEVSSNENTIATCEATLGCGHFTFSQDMKYSEINTEFNLSSIAYVSDGSTEVQSNVSVISHITAELLKDTHINEQSINITSANIASLFSLENNYTNVKPFKTHQLSSVNNQENIEGLKYSIFNSGIANALYQDERDLSSVSTRITSAIEDLKFAQGKLLAIQDEDASFEFTVSNTYGGAVTAAQFIASTLPEEQRQIVDQLAVEIENTQQSKIAKISGNDARVEPTPTLFTSGENLDKAKAMVNDIRVFANLFDISGNSTSSLISQGKELEPVLKDTTKLLKDELESFTLLNETISAIGQINREINDGLTTGNVFNIKDYTTLPDITGTVILNKSGRSFFANISSEQSVIQITAGIQTHAGNKAEKISLNGLLSTPSFELKVKQASYANFEFLTDSAQRSSDELSGGDLALNIELKSKGQDNNLNFSGQFEFDFVTNSALSSEDRELVIIPNSMLLLGDFSDDNANSIFALLTVMIQNAEEQLDVDSYQNLLNSLKIDTGISVSSSINEYETSVYLFMDDTNGKNQLLNLSLTYSEPDTNSARKLSVVHDSENKTTLLTNPEKVRLEIFDKSITVNGEAQLGKVTLDSEELAIIIKRDNLTMIRYKDGSLETL